jgi:hypothetical protein
MLGTFDLIVAIGYLTEQQAGMQISGHSKVFAGLLPKGRAGDEQTPA